MADYKCHFEIKIDGNRAERRKKIRSLRSKLSTAFGIVLQVEHLCEELRGHNVETQVSEVQGRAGEATPTD